MDRFVEGDVVSLTNTFKVSGTATDPTAVTLTVYAPDQTSVGYTYPSPATITRTSAGLYTKNITADQNGIWRYVWTGTGTAADTADGSFTVSSAADFTNYTTIEELRDELGNYATTDTSDDAKMQRSIDAACRQIDNWCGQRFWQDSTATARTFAPDNTLCLDLSDSEGIATATGLVVKLDLNDVGTYGTTLTTSTDFLLRPTNAQVLNPARPYTEIGLTGVNYWFQRSSYGRDLVQITAKWGWPAVPAEVNKAALIQAADLFKSKDATFGLAGVFAGVSDMGVMRVTSGIHRIAKALLEPYRRVAVG